jgi:hypothetical protein
MVAIAFSRLHKKLLLVRLVFYVETYCCGDFRRSFRNGSSC